jgi:nucleoside-diphosphate-sugar epimerase
VVHLAGIASPVHGSINQIYESNVVGTATLLQALEYSGSSPRIVIVASSATVYAETSGTHPIVENDRLEPRTHYGVSKLSVEHICRLFSDRLNIRVVRPFNYTGPGQSINFLAPKIVKHFADGASTIELGNLNLERDISDLRDVVECYVRLIECPGGETINLCSGKLIKLADIVSFLSDISGRPMSVVTNPDFLRENEPYSICGSREALDRLIGTWDRKSISETLTWMYSEAIENR